MRSVTFGIQRTAMVGMITLGVALITMTAAQPALARIAPTAGDQVAMRWDHAGNIAPSHPLVMLAKGPIMLQRKERGGRPVDRMRLLTPSDVQGFSGTSVPGQTASEVGGASGADQLTEPLVRIDFVMPPGLEVLGDHTELPPLGPQQLP